MKTAISQQAHRKIQNSRTHLLKYTYDIVKKTARIVFNTETQNKYMNKQQTIIFKKKMEKKQMKCKMLMTQRAIDAIITTKRVAQRTQWNQFH